MNNKTIELHTIATFQGKEYELENLLNGLLNKLEEKDKEIDIMKKYFQMIIDLGYDYDGFNNVEDLKDLIDDLCIYANLGKECNTTETIYVNGNKKYNILDKELGDDND